MIGEKQMMVDVKTERSWPRDMPRTCSFQMVIKNSRLMKLGEITLEWLVKWRGNTSEEERLK